MLFCGLSVINTAVTHVALEAGKVPFKGSQDITAKCVEMKRI